MCVLHPAEYYSVIYIYILVSQCVCELADRNVRIRLQALIVPGHLQIGILFVHHRFNVLLQFVDLDAGHLAEECAAQRRGEYQHESDEARLNWCIGPRCPMEETPIG